MSNKNSKHTRCTKVPTVVQNIIVCTLTGSHTDCVYSYFHTLLSYMRMYIATYLKGEDNFANCFTGNVLHARLHFCRHQPTYNAMESHVGFSLQSGADQWFFVVFWKTVKILFVSAHARINGAIDETIRAHVRYESAILEGLPML